MVTTNLMATIRAHKLYRHIRARSFGRFFLIGICNTIVGVGNFPVLYWLLGSHLTVNILLVLGWMISTISAFILHKLVTFESAGTFGYEGFKFLVLSLLTLLINMLIMDTVMHFTKVHPVLIQFVTSTALSLALMLFNYFGMSRFIFVTPKIAKNNGEQ